MSGLRCEQLIVQQVGPCDLQVNRGEIICLSGISGCGKSLLLRAIADLIPHQGRVLLDEIAADQIAPTQWRKQVGFLPAEPQWWFDSIGEHFTHIPSAELTALALDAQALNWPVARCSTGEKQRLALLRLLSRTPQCLLLDEPTASLDAANTARVETFIQQQVHDRQLMVIWVSHQESQINRVAQQHYELTHGKLVRHA